MRTEPKFYNIQPAADRVVVASRIEIGFKGGNLILPSKADVVKKRLPIRKK